MKNSIFSLSLCFLVLSIITGVLGFWIIVGIASLIVRILFFLFLVGFLASLLKGKGSSFKKKKEPSFTL